MGLCIPCNFNKDALRSFCDLCVSIHSVLDKEYMDALSWISPVVEKHTSTLVAGIPQLNMCDVAVMVRFTQNQFF